MATIDTINMQINSGGARSSATALPDHNRALGFIQNVGANPLFVKFGSGCTTVDYDLILKASSIAADGSGASTSFSKNGIVTIAGTSPSYTAWEE
jgi:hypothetical protein